MKRIALFMILVGTLSAQQLVFTDLRRINRITLTPNPFSVADGAFKVVGEVAATSSTAAQTSVGTTAGQILASNASRKQAIIQNTGTTVIKLILGSGTPTQTIYHVSLKAGTAADDGTGGSFITDLWTGAIQAISSASGGTIVVTELTL